MFVTLGLITSVPVSAGKLSIISQQLYVSFELQSVDTKTCLSTSPFRSVGHCSVWREFCWNEIGWRYTDSNRFLLGHVSEQLARLHNTFAQVKSIILVRSVRRMNTLHNYAYDLSHMTHTFE